MIRGGSRLASLVAIVRAQIAALGANRASPRRDDNDGTLRRGAKPSGTGGAVGIGLVLLLLVLLMIIVSPDFRRLSNLVNIIQQSAVLAVVALGMTLPILTGGIDLSVGSVAALGGALSAGLIARQGLDPAAAVPIALLLGALLGGVNGLLIIVGRMPPFVATLSMLAVARGLTLVYTGGAPISCSHPGFVALASGRVGPIPSPAIIVVALLALLAILLRHTRYGLHLYALGGSVETARLAGIRVRAIGFSVYVISGVCAVLGGVLLAARLWSAQPTAAVGLELEAIAAVVLGGTSLFGGVGTVGGTVIGTMVIGVLSNSMNLLEVSAYLQRLIRGAILIAAVAIDVRVRKGRARR